MVHALLSGTAMRPGLTLVVIAVASSCGDGLRSGGANCDALLVPQTVSALPIQSRSSVPEDFFQWSELIAATEELKCCGASTVWIGPPANPRKCNVQSCEALRSTLTIGLLRGRFANEPCGNRGTNTCRAVMQGDMVIGVSAYCSDSD